MSLNEAKKAYAEGKEIFKIKKPNKKSQLSLHSASRDFFDRDCTNFIRRNPSLIFLLLRLDK